MNKLFYMATFFFMFIHFYTFLYDSTPSALVRNKVKLLHLEKIGFLLI